MTEEYDHNSAGADETNDGKTLNVPQVVVGDDDESDDDVDTG